MASREELLQSIHPGMRLTRDFFMRIYGYELTWSGFASMALEKLEAAGCSRAGEYYMQFAGEYERQQEESIKPIAAEYVRELEQAWKKKEGDVLRIRKRILQILQNR